MIGAVSWTVSEETVHRVSLLDEAEEVEWRNFQHLIRGAHFLARMLHQGVPAQLRQPCGCCAETPVTAVLSVLFKASS